MIHSAQELKGILGEKFDLGVKNVHATSDDELVISGRDDKMLEVLDYLASACDARIVGQYVTDAGSNLELVDVLFMNHLRSRVYIKIDIDAREKKATSIATIFPAARWLEKYQSEFLAIDFTPRPTKAKDGEITASPAADPGIPWIPFQVDDIVDKTRMPGGPGIFDPKLDLFSYSWVKTRQTIVSANRCQLGHFHRGMIKIAEATPVAELPPIIARTCWRDKWHALAAVSVAVERAAGIDAKIPQHAIYWRAFCCELERLKNHHEFLISWLHIAGQFAMAKKHVVISRLLDVLEKFFFDDATRTPFIVPGGVTHDPIAKGKVTRPAIDEALRAYERAFANDGLVDRGFFDSFAGVGKVSKADALRAGLTGPALRASGVPYDARADFPQGAYKQGLLRWDTCVGVEGDVQARVELHAHEMTQSIRLMYQLGELLAETPVSEASRVDIPNINAGAEGFAVVESARGELHAYVKASKDPGKLATLRIVTPSFLNFTALEQVAGSAAIRKMPYIVHSINPCWACIDQ